MASSSPKRKKEKGKRKKENPKTSSKGRKNTPFSFKAAAFQSLCAVQNLQNSSKSHAAASLLQAATYGLRALLADNQDEDDPVTEWRQARVI